jgi:hypothetical protein
MFEGVLRFGRGAAPEGKSRLGQLVERAVELGLRVGCDCRDELVVELPPDRRADLRNFLCCWRAIEARREGVSQR